ncbi:hypothetical protein [Arthrobacter sp. ov118]|nr:hypothetical protein [Arthrobacter sp. ov118]
MSASPAAALPGGALLDALGTTSLAWVTFVLILAAVMVGFTNTK